jgi:Flp pilus assembly protein TadD
MVRKLPEQVTSPFFASAPFLACRLSLVKPREKDTCRTLVPDAGKNSQLCHICQSKLSFRRELNIRHPFITKFRSWYSLSLSLMNDTSSEQARSETHPGFPLSVITLVILCAPMCQSLWGQNAPARTSPTQGQFTQYVADGSQALQQGDNALAEQAFRKALDLDPRSVEILNNLAISIARQQREAEAIALYERALKIKPGDVVTQRNLGVAYFRAHQYRLALPLLETSAKTSTSFQTLELAGLDAFALDQYEKAARYLQAAQRLQPDDIETLDMLGKAYLRTKNYAGVTDVFRQIMALNPDSAAAHTMMAMAYDKMYREEDAIREFDAARASDPTYPGIHTGLGIIYWRNDNLDAAEREFREELSRYPQDPIANCTMGRILRRRDKTSEAIVYLKAALAVNPSYRDALLELGESYIRLQQPALAVEPLKKAIALAPDDAEAHFILGTALDKSGNTVEGTKEREISARLRPRQRTQEAKPSTVH